MPELAKMLVSQPPLLLVYCSSSSELPLEVSIYQIRMLDLMNEFERTYTNNGFPDTLGSFSRSTRTSLTSFILCLSLESSTKMIPWASPYNSLQVPLSSSDPPTSSKVTR